VLWAGRISAGVLRDFGLNGASWPSRPEAAILAMLKNKD